MSCLSTKFLRPYIFNLPNHPYKHMAVCGVSVHHGNAETRKTLEQKFIFQIVTLIKSVQNHQTIFIQLIILVFYITMLPPFYTSSLAPLLTI